MKETPPAPLKRALGVCYYPEHWPREVWARDAARMAGLGLAWVRIGEFAWSRLEPVPGALSFDWLDEAVETLGAAGLRVVLGTPTATPPRWMLDRHPDMLACDASGRPRGFGSRRHYCFSHEGYRAEAARIVTELARRYGRNPHVGAWQTDNEYGCHDTALSYSPAAHAAFRDWLRARYRGDEGDGDAGGGGKTPGKNDGDIAALNAAWGNVFWSMDYDDFGQIGLPNLTVTEPNPAHALAFRRFSSEQVVRFNRLQAEIIRAHSDAPIAHNYMGRIVDFDHFAVGADLDIASWDSYPLGFLEDRVAAPQDHKRRFARIGDPDFQAFHHDLYRAVGRGRWWVMEQQPGPVNWAPFNPAPLAGMVRLWAWEAFAHGAETVSFFRWRQAPMAQEQMHAGLLRPDGAEAPAFAEVADVAAALAGAPDVAPARAPVALIFDYASAWAWDIQPHGRGLSHFDCVFDIYRALRRLGLSIDILAPDAPSFEEYALILAPGAMLMDDALKNRLAACPAQVMLGPRAAARDGDMNTPVPLPPAVPGLEVTVARAESFRPDSPLALERGGALILYRECLEGSAEVVERTTDGAPALMRSGRLWYLAGRPCPDAAQRILRELCAAAGLETLDLPEGLRRRETGTERFWFNHTESEIAAAGRVFAPLSVLREALE